MYINKEDYKIDKLAEGYKIEKFESKNIEFAGYKEGSAFIQFRSGGTYFYQGVDRNSVISGDFRNQKTWMNLIGRVVVPKVD